MKQKYNILCPLRALYTRYSKISVNNSKEFIKRFSSDNAGWHRFFYMTRLLSRHFDKMAQILFRREIAMEERLVCETCGCTFFDQEDEGYYCSDCERFYSFYEAFELMDRQAYREYEAAVEESTVLFSIAWVFRWDT